MPKEKKKNRVKERREVASNSEMFAININDLDHEWEAQPKLCSRIADKLAKAKRELGDVEMELEYVKAEIAYNVRHHPDDYGIEKITEPVVKETIPLQPAYKEALQKYIDAKYVVDRLTGDAKSVDHRKYALQELVELRLADHFSEPRAKSSGSKKAMEEAGKSALRKRMQQNREEDDE